MTPPRVPQRPEVRRLVQPAVITVPPAGLAFKTSAGQVLATLFADQSGGGNLTVYNNLGAAVASLSSSVRGGGGLLTIYNEMESPVATLSSMPDPNDPGHLKSGQLLINRGNGNLVASLSDSAEASLSLYDWEGKYRSDIRSTGYFLNNTSGQSAVEIGAGGIPGSGWIRVMRYGNSEMEISVIDPGKMEAIGHVP
jgi:hypothetical protein